jgi:hypothetical protein
MFHEPRIQLAIVTTSIRDHGEAPIAREDDSPEGPDSGTGLTVGRPR